MTRTGLAAGPESDAGYSRAVQMMGTSLPVWAITIRADARAERSMVQHGFLLLAMVVVAAACYSPAPTLNPTTNTLDIMVDVEGKFV